MRPLSHFATTGHSSGWETADADEERDEDDADDASEGWDTAADDDDAALASQEAMQEQIGSYMALVASSAAQSDVRQSDARSQLMGIIQSPPPNPNPQSTQFLVHAVMVQVAQAHLQQIDAHDEQEQRSRWARLSDRQLLGILRDRSIPEGHQALDGAWNEINRRLAQKTAHPSPKFLPAASTPRQTPYAVQAAASLHAWNMRTQRQAQRQAIPQWQTAKALGDGYAAVREETQEQAHTWEVTQIRQGVARPERAPTAEAVARPEYSLPWRPLGVPGGLGAPIADE